MGLDLLRFVAVALVIGRHIDFEIPAAYLPIRAWKRGGWVGVDLFFVLSGFLVSSLLFKEYLRDGSINVKRFLIRRGFKIYPAFWVFLAISVVVTTARDQLPPWNVLLGEILFFQNYVGHLWDHTWSLAVEEHFYFAIAALVAFLIRRRPENSFAAMPKLFLAVALVCLGFRIVTHLTYPEYDHDTHLFRTHLRVDSLFFGVLLAYLVHFDGLKEKVAHVPSWLFFLAGAVLLTPAFAGSLESTPWISVVGVISLYFGSGLLLLAAIRLEASTSRILAVLGALGAASYSVYLWHIPMTGWVYPWISQMTGIDGFAFYLTTYFCGAFAIGWLMNRLLETPVIRLRDYAFPSSVKAVDMKEPSPAEAALPETAGRA